MKFTIHPALIASIFVMNALSAANSVNKSDVIQSPSLTQWIQQCKDLKPQQIAESPCSVQELIGTLQAFTIHETARLLKQSWIQDDKPDYQGFQPCTQKLVLSAKSQMYVWGDLHGDIQTLVLCLEKLHRDKILSDSFLINKPQTYLLFLGDYTDRGQHGAEIWYTLVRLKRANPEHVFMVRGNHEEISLNVYHGFVKELSRKFPLEQEELLTLINQSYQLLPVALYLGCKGPRGVTRYLQCCHGGMEIGYHPSELLNYPGNSAYEKITSLLREHHFNFLESSPEIQGEFFRNQHVPLEHFINISSDQFDPTDIGFMWSDFSALGNTKLSWFQSHRGMSFGQDLTEAIFRYQNSPSHRIEGVLRGHQHNPTMPGLLGNPHNKGLYKLPWNASIFTTVASQLFIPAPCFLKLTINRRFTNWKIARMFLVEGGWETQENKITKWQSV